MQDTKKSMTHGVRVGWTITLASCLAIVLATAAWIIVYRSVGSRTTNAPGLLTLITLSGCFAIAGLISGPVIIFTKRHEAKEIEEIHAGQNVFAHWLYAPDEWSRYIKHELARARKRFLIIFIPVTVIILASTLPTTLRGSQPGGKLALSLIVPLIPAGFLALVLWAILYSPILAARKRNRGDVYISSRGVLLNDRYYSWKVFGSSGSPDVSYEAGEPPIVQFKWIVGAGRSTQSRSVRVPVPRAHEQETQQVLTHFRS
ncbi:MAG: hypothetical protein QOJ02_4150 [Acidobacteriota bacterium]|jgi:hypothetical protein|nr:hypothetical protein [Acidobacteriota bacterium]